MYIGCCQIIDFLHAPLVSFSALHQLLGKFVFIYEMFVQELRHLGCLSRTWLVTSETLRFRREECVADDLISGVICTFWISFLGTC